VNVFPPLFCSKPSLPVSQTFSKATFSTIRDMIKVFPFLALPGHRPLYYLSSTVASAKNHVLFPPDRSQIPPSILFGELCPLPSSRGIVINFSRRCLLTSPPPDDLPATCWLLFPFSLHHTSGFLFLEMIFFFFSLDGSSAFPLFSCDHGACRPVPSVGEFTSSCYLMSPFFPLFSCSMAKFSSANPQPS